VQNAQQVVVAVARTLQFYSGQSDVQMSAQTQQQVVDVVAVAVVVVAVVVVVVVVVTTTVTTTHPLFRRFRPT
jgi:hypothetical protein